MEILICLSRICPNLEDTETLSEHTACAPSRGRGDRTIQLMLHQGYVATSLNAAPVCDEASLRGPVEATRRQASQLGLGLRPHSRRRRGPPPSSPRSRANGQCAAVLLAPRSAALCPGARWCDAPAPPAGLCFQPRCRQRSHFQSCKPCLSVLERERSAQPDWMA